MELRDGPVFDILTRGDWKTEWIYQQGMPGSVQSESGPPKSPSGGPLRVSSLPDFFVSSIRAAVMTKLPGLIARTGFLPNSMRVRAVEQLLEARTPEAATELLPLMESPDASVRASAIAGIKTLGRIVVRPAMEQLGVPVQTRHA